MQHSRNKSNKHRRQQTKSPKKIVQAQPDAHKKSEQLPPTTNLLAASPVVAPPKTPQPVAIGTQFASGTPTTSAHKSTMASASEANESSIASTFQLDNSNITSASEADKSNIITTAYIPRSHDVQHSSPVRWLLSRRIVTGTITLVQGDRDSQHHLYLDHLAVQITSGTPITGDQPVTAANDKPLTSVVDQQPASVQGGVIIISPNMEPGEHFNQLMALGADTSRLRILSTVCDRDPQTGELDLASERPFRFSDDFALLQRSIDEINACLLIIHPFADTLPSAPRSNQTLAKETLRQLNQLAARKNIACIITRQARSTARGLSHQLPIERSNIYTNYIANDLLIVASPIERDRFYLTHLWTLRGRLAETITYTLVHEGPEQQSSRVTNSTSEPQITTDLLQKSTGAMLSTALLVHYLLATISESKNNEPIAFSTLCTRFTRSTPKELRTTLNRLIRDQRITHDHKTNTYRLPNQTIQIDQALAA